MNSELEKIKIDLQEAQLRLIMAYLIKMIFELNNNQDTLTPERVDAYKDAATKIGQEIFIIINLTNAQSKDQRINDLFRDFVRRDVL